MESRRPADPMRAAAAWPAFGLDESPLTRFEAQGADAAAMKETG